MKKIVGTQYRAKVTATLLAATSSAIVLDISWISTGATSTAATTMRPSATITRVRSRLAKASPPSSSSFVGAHELGDEDRVQTAADGEDVDHRRQGVRDGEAVAEHRGAERGSDDQGPDESGQPRDEGAGGHDRAGLEESGDLAAALRGRGCRSRFGLGRYRRLPEPSWSRKRWAKASGSCRSSEAGSRGRRRRRTAWSPGGPRTAGAGRAPPARGRGLRPDARVRGVRGGGGCW